MFELDEIRKAASLVYERIDPTPQIAWPLLEAATGAKVWVKHENHTPVGAFKIRGGITFIDWLQKTMPNSRGVVSATRGNHGQSMAKAATEAGLNAKILVPKGNSVEKNSAMRALGADLIEFGADFDEARLEAARLSESEGLFMVPPFHRELVRGVATYALELFTRLIDLDTVYVPIGCGSGICGLISVRDSLGLDTKVVGVVSKHAPAVKLSVEAGKLIESNSARTFADGIAVRVPIQEPFDQVSRGADRIVTVSDQEVAEAIRILLRTTHNVAEGAGAAPVAALLKERELMEGKSVAVILSGGNIDEAWLREVLAGRVPKIL